MRNNYSKINNICLLILTAIGITAALIYTKAILIPFVIALFIYAVLVPGVKWVQTKLRLPRIVSLIVIISIVIIILGLIIFFISSSLERFFKSSDIYKDEIIQFVQFTSDLISKWGIQIDNVSIQKKFSELPVFTVAKDITGGIFTFAGNTVLIIIFVLFLIAGEIKGFATHSFAIKIQLQISRYVATKFLISLITGLLIGLLLGFCKVKFAFMFAILTVLLNFIPNLGSLVAIILPLPVVLLQFGFSFRFFVILIFSILIQFSIGNILEPKIMGENMDLHPVTILIFLMFWGLVWGIPGMFLAVPITAVLKIVLSRIENTKPVAEFLAGRL